MDGCESVRSPTSNYLLVVRLIPVYKNLWGLDLLRILSSQRLKYRTEIRRFKILACASIVFTFFWIFTFRNSHSPLFRLSAQTHDTPSETHAPRSSAQKLTLPVLGSDSETHHLILSLLLRTHHLSSRDSDHLRTLQFRIQKLTSKNRKQATTTKILVVYSRRFNKIVAACISSETFRNSTTTMMKCW